MVRANFGCSQNTRAIFFSCGGQSGEPRARHRSRILRRAPANQADQTTCRALGSCGLKKCDEPQQTEARSCSFNQLPRWPVSFRTGGVANRPFIELMCGRQSPKPTYGRHKSSWIKAFCLNGGLNVRNTNCGSVRKSSLAVSYARERKRQYYDREQFAQ